jgi:hypothetical protein
MRLFFICFKEISMSDNIIEVEDKPEAIDVLLEKLRLEQNPGLAIASALVAAALGALVWAVVTVLTGYQIGYMAIGVGLLVGFSVRHFGKGIDMLYGIIGASAALIGCVLGNAFTIVHFAAASITASYPETASYFAALSYIDFSLLPEAMIDTFQAMDLLFYGIAIYEGYKFSFRKLETA